jgi:outer membrane receptor protein involved in Fe transport
VIDKGINSSNWDVLKLAVKAKLNDAWTITPSLFAQRYKSNDIDAAYLSVGDYQSANKGVPLQLFQTSKIVREPGKDSLTVPTLTVNGDVGFADLTGIVSGYKRRFERVQDGTSINSVYIGSVVADTALGAIVGLLPSAVQLNNTIDQTSLELRMQSKDYDAKNGSPITWIGGVYYAKTKTQVYDNEPIFGINAAFTAAGHDINDPAQLTDSFPGAFLGDSSYYSARHYNDKQTSLFGELTYHASPELSGTVGLRVLKASQHFTREGDFYYAGGPSTAVIDSSANAVTPRFAINWDMDPTTTVFGNIAKGFRLGGANRPVPNTALVTQDLQTLGLPFTTAPESFKPDSLWSYEVGTKSLLLDKRLSLNVSAFYIDWKNIQQDVTLPLSGFDFETNVGRAKSYGLEFEAKLRATEALTLNAAVGLVRATFAEDTPALGKDSNGDLNVRKGDPIQGAPKYNISMGFEYRFHPISSGDAFVRGSGKWVGPSHGSFVRDQKDYQRPAYFTADGSTGLSFDHWEFTLFAKNLTNVKKVIQQPSIQAVDEAYYLRPRTIGLTASYEFF